MTSEPNTTRADKLLAFSSILFSLAQAGLQVTAASQTDVSITLVNYAVMCDLDPEDYKTIVRNAATHRADLMGAMPRGY